MANPKFLGADLLGDSMLLRFSLRHADETPYFPRYPSSWGMCRSGKTAEELLVEEWTDNTGPFNNHRVVIMIGTNDVLRICSDTNNLAKAKKPFKHSIMKIRNKAMRKFTHVYFCTVPEIPRLAESEEESTRARYINLLPWINSFIMTFDETDEYAVTSIDLQGKFSRDCYERFMGRGENRRQDDIHLNDKGQAILREILRETIRIE